MKNYIIQTLDSEPGIQRDGTIFAAKAYIDGQWCRFYLGKPRKIGGYKLIDIGNNEIIRTLFVVPQSNNTVDVYLGRTSSVAYINFDFNGVGTVEVDRTPVGGIPPFLDNLWDFDLFTNSTVTDASNSFLIGHVAPNGVNSTNTTNGPIYYGITNPVDPADVPLKPIVDELGNPIEVSGGIVFASPFLIAYGNDGFIRWSNVDGTISLPTSWPDDNTQVIANTKILKMLRTRGSATPQLLAWTVNSLINVTYSVVDDTGVFSAATIQDNITVLSPSSIVLYEQQYFWIGIDQFYFFNGIVQTLENTMSTDWFFQNINLKQRAIVWGIVVPRYKEIWWFYPRGENQIECNAVIIYNVQSKVWYDSLIGRAAGASANTFPFPLMSDTNLTRTLSTHGFIYTYGLWMHEFGENMIVGNQTSAIQSYYETNIMTLFAGDPANNRLVRSRRVEPDFQQIGNMTITVNNRMFANSPIISSGPYVFDNTTEKIDDINSQGRLVSFVFESNIVNGYYQGGKSLLCYEIGDINP